MLRQQAAELVDVQNAQINNPEPVWLNESIVRSIKMKRALSDDAEESNQDIPFYTPSYRLEFIPSSVLPPTTKRKILAKACTAVKKSTHAVQDAFSWTAIEKDIARERGADNRASEIGKRPHAIKRGQRDLVEKLKSQALAKAYKHADVISKSSVASTTVVLVQTDLYPHIEPTRHAVLSQHALHVRHSDQNLLQNSVEWLQIVKTFSVVGSGDSISQDDVVIGTAAIHENAEEIRLDDMLVELPVADFASACYAHFRLRYCLPDNGAQLLSTLTLHWKKSMPDRRLVFYVLALRTYLAGVSDRSAIPLKQIMVEQAVNHAHTSTNCPFYFVEDYAELADLIGRLTKAIEKRPLRLAKRSTYRRVIGFCGQAIEKAGAVKVDAATGAGSRELWLKQLSMLPSVHGNRLLSEKVAEQYLSPFNLRGELQSWGSEQKTVAEMQHLQIKHGAERTRKLGPMLSRQLFSFYTSTNPDQLLRCSP